MLHLNLNGCLYMQEPDSEDVVVACSGGGDDVAAGDYTSQ